MAVTLQDIANACGVSRGTVDRALNTKGRISEETKQMVLAKAKELGYKPNLLARSLATGSTMTIGIVVLDLSNRYFTQIVNAVSFEARQHGYSVEILIHEIDFEGFKKNMDKLIGKGVDGIVLCPYDDSLECAEYIKNLSIPIVTIGTRYEDVPNVGIDEYNAARDATRLILHKGYKDLVFVAPPLSICDFTNDKSMDVHRRRLKGVKDTLAEQENECKLTVLDNYSFLDKASALISSVYNKPAFLCSGDIYALEIFRTLKSKNLTPPQDYGIMGFDNIDILRYIQPQFSTVDIPLEECGVEAAKKLLDMIKGEEIQQQTELKYQILDNESL